MKPLMQRVVAAFQARDFAGLTTACGELVDVIENWPVQGEEGDSSPAR